MSQSEPAGPDGVRRCVCPGSYDPVTNGHLDILGRASALFDEVVVAILHNPGKQGTFEIADRIALVEDAVRRLPAAAASPRTGQIQVRAYSGRLLVDVCRELGAVAVVKGLRGPADFGYEQPMARMNHHLSGLETVFLGADPAWEHVSSSLVKEVAAYGGDVTGLVPAAVQERLVALRAARSSESEA